MSKQKKDQSTEYDFMDDDHDLVVERHPHCKTPILPIVIILILFVIYFFPEFEESLVQNIPATQIATKPSKQTQTEDLNLHRLVARASLNQIEEAVSQIDKEDLNKVANGMTPIMLAASRGDVEIIDLLFTQGADPNKRGSMERTALQYAAEKNHIDVAKRLLAYGADIDAYDNGRLTPLLMAASRNYTELGLLFIQAGADVNIQHVQGWTALIDAAAHNNEKLVKALLKAGADRELKAKNGKTAMDYAREYGFPNMVKILSQ